MLSGDKLSRAEAIFQSIVALPENQRHEALIAQCDGDDELRQFVLSLLQSDAQGLNSFLETPAIKVTHSEAIEADELPRQIGRYEVIRKIGQGGMGVVYEARQENPHRTVALKVIAPGIGSRQVLKRFQLEAEILGQLQHPGIATVYEAGVAEFQSAAGHSLTQPFLAMELIRGRPLLDEVKEKKLGTRERLELLARVADAVHHAHQRGVIHRDLKPANILVVGAEDQSSSSRSTPSHARSTTMSPRFDDLGQPKILDFGVARATDADIQTVTMRTDIGQLIGTVPYMSPEQVAGDPAQVDMRCDVYALGVILYEMLAERLPLDVRNRSIPEAARIIREEEPSRLSSVNTVFRGDVETIVSRAMEKDKDRRYQSAADFAGDIRRYLRDEPIVARPASAAYQLRKFAKRNKVLVAGVTATFVALALGVIGMAWFALQESRQRQRAETRFNEVRSLANTMITDVYDEIAGISGATKAREKIVSTAIQYLDNLAAEAGDDPKLLDELAGGYARLAVVQALSSQSNLGDTEGAMESAKKSLRLRQRLIELVPDHIDYQLLLGSAHELMSMTLRRLGKTPEAIEHTRAQLKVVENASAIDPADPHVSTGLAHAHGNLGRMLAAIGQFKEGITHLTESRAFFAKAAKEQPDDEVIPINLLMNIGNIAELNLQLKNFDDAKTYLEEGLQIGRTLLSAKPDDPRILSVFASLLRAMGLLHMKLEQPDRAIDYYEEMRALRKRQLELDPADFNARRNLAVSEFMIGDVFQQDKDFEAALTHFLRYRELIEEVVELDPRYVVARRDLALAHQRLCAIYKALEKTDDAMQSARAALDLMKSLHAQDEQDVLLNVDLSTCHFDVGDILAQMAKTDPRPPADRLKLWQDARTELEKSREILDRLVATNRLPPMNKPQLEQTARALADCAEAIESLSGSQASGPADPAG